MFINDLPDDCLWMIFDRFFNLEELIRLSKVCSRWSNLISVKFSRIKYLFKEDTIHHIPPPIYDYTKLWISDPETIKNHNLRELLPNLRILDISTYFYGCDKHEEFSELINNNTKIKGLIGVDYINHQNLNLENIEMVAMNMDIFTGHIISTNNHYTKVFRPNQLNQIYQDYVLHLNDLSELVVYFPNLKRLHFTLEEELVRYNGPNLSNLRIFEFSISNMNENYNAIHVMDFCPSLESAYIFGQSDDEFTNMAQKNYNLRDLVIERFGKGNITWPFLRKLLCKYPNLHHLAVRGVDTVKDDHVGELVQLLPKIKLLDFRSSKNVTARSADFLSEYCHKSNRSIKIYYNCEKEPTDWPKYTSRKQMDSSEFSIPREPIVYGFDFMKHCFYKHFCQLPYLLDE